MRGGGESATECLNYQREKLLKRSKDEKTPRTEGRGGRGDLKIKGRGGGKEKGMEMGDEIVKGEVGTR